MDLWTNLTKKKKKGSKVTNALLYIGLYSNHEKKFNYT